MRSKRLKPICKTKLGTILLWQRRAFESERSENHWFSLNNPTWVYLSCYLDPGRPADARVLQNSMHCCCFSRSLCPLAELPSYQKTPQTHYCQTLSMGHYHYLSERRKKNNNFTIGKKQKALKRSIFTSSLRPRNAFNPFTNNIILKG